MRRFVIGATVVMVVGLASSVLIAQTKITTLEEHAKLMKANAGAAGAANKALASGAFADAKAQVAILRGNFMVLQGFWAEKKVAEASTIVKDALTQMDALDKLLAAPAPDQMAAQAALKGIQGSCGACHKSQRDGDPQTGYKFKPGVL